MSERTGWSRFLNHQAQSPPLKYVTGICNAVAHDYYCEVHHHRGLEIVYHPTGSGTTRLPERDLSLPFQEDSVIIYDAMEKHDQTMVTGGHDFCVQIEMPEGPGLLPQGGLHIPHVQTPVLIEDLRLLSHGYMRLSKTEQMVFNLRATTLLVSLLNLHSSLTRSAAATPAERYVIRAETYVREHLGEIESVSEIAEHAGISAHYLRHLFKEQRGKSLIRHVNEMRIDRAKSLLSHSRLPMKQIASLCGLKDEYYFSALFRSMVQIAPGHYRRLHG